MLLAAECCLPSSALLTCRGRTAVKAVAAHASGPKLLQHDGRLGYTGVRGMRIYQQGKVTVLLTGGADGIIKQYNVSDGSIQVSGVQALNTNGSCTQRHRRSAPLLLCCCTTVE